VRPNADQRAGQLSLPHVAISKTERNKTTNIKPMSSSYNTPCNKHKLVVSIYSNIETSLAMSTLAIWCRIVQYRDVSPHNFDGLATSGLAFSVAPAKRRNEPRPMCLVDPVSPWLFAFYHELNEYSTTAMSFLVCIDQTYIYCANQSTRRRQIQTP